MLFFKNLKVTLPFSYEFVLSDKVEFDSLAAYGLQSKHLIETAIPANNTEMTAQLALNNSVIPTLLYTEQDCCFTQ